MWVERKPQGGGGRGAPGAATPSRKSAPGDGGPQGVGPHHPARVPRVGTAHPGGWGPHRSQSRAGPRSALCAVAASRHLAGVRRTRIELRRGRHFRTCTQCSDARTAQARRAHQRREEPSVLILQPTGTPRRRRRGLVGTCRRPGWVRSVEKCRFGAQSCCRTSQRCVRPRRRT